MLQIRREGEKTWHNIARESQKPGRNLARIRQRFASPSSNAAGAHQKRWKTLLEQRLLRERRAEALAVNGA